MLNLKKADLTTSEQKVVAAILLAIGLVVLYVVLPPLVVLFKNIVLLCVWGGIIALLCLFWPVLWDYAKQLSWELTKQVISSDPVWHLRRGVEYMESKMTELSKHVNAVASIKKQTINEVNKLIDENTSLEIQHSRANEPNARKIIERKIETNARFIETLQPKIEMAKSQEEEMSKLLDVWRVDTTIIAQDIEGLARQYELMKQLNAATVAANAFMKKDSPEMKMFKESMRQTEKRIFDYTSNVESFQREVAPTLSLSSGRAELLESEGLKRIEEYRAKRLSKK